MKEFSELPRPIQCMIRVRMEQQGNENTAKYTRSRDCGGFNWGDTPEEFDFWNKVINYYQYDTFFDRYPHLKNNTNSNIDYTDPNWWKILEEGDEIIVVELRNTLDVSWLSLKIGTILKVTNTDVDRIEKEKECVCFNNNRCGVNFTYNMVKLHKKKKKKNLNINNNNNDVSKSSNPIQHGIGRNGLNLPSGECKITTGSRLIGTTTCFGSSQTSVKCGVLSPFQYR